MSTEIRPNYDNHPAMFRTRPLAYISVVILIIAPVITLLMFRKEIMEVGGFLAMILLAATGAGLVTMLYWFLTTRATRLRIAGDEIHLEEGLLNKTHTDLNVSQIRAVSVYQDFFERIFGVGRIEVFTTGDDPEFVISGMPSPHLVRDHVRNRREVAE